MQRVSVLTNMSVAPTKESHSAKVSEIGGIARRTIFSLITDLEAGAYAVGTLIVLMFAIATISQHLRDPMRLQYAFSGLVLCGSVAAFSLTMAVVDVFCCPIIYSGYNMLGFSPLSVLGAFGLVLLMAWLRMDFARGTGASVDLETTRGPTG